MKTNNRDKSNHLWAYIHHQLSQTEQLDVAEKIATDQTLQAEVDAIKSIDKMLHFFVPLLDRTEEDLERDILEAWECSQVQEQETTQHSRAEIIHFDTAPDTTKQSFWSMFNPATLRVAVAAAACLLVVVGIRNYYSSPLDIGSPSILSSTQYRGIDSADNQPLYTENEIEEFSLALNDVIKKNYAESQETFKRSIFHRNTQWIILTKWQELYESSLYVQVEAYDPGQKDVSREWTGHFENAESFYDQVDTFGSTVAKDLATMPDNGVR